MRVLIYGGCHAGVLKRVLSRHAAGEHVFDTLINFQLIRTKTPFPYERLGQYDAVVFSPVLNQGDWNTEYLEAACKTAGIKTVKFPWLQWGGYWPKARKRYWGRNAEWGLPSLTDLGYRIDGFEPFYEALFDPAHFEADLSGWLDFTTTRLMEHERAGGVDIRISDWIIQNYAAKQLFLTPDHPSTELYKFVMHQLGELLGLRLDPGFYASSLQLQEGVRLPILPAMQKALGLSFASAEWAHHDFLGHAFYGLREFALSYHDKSRVRLAEATSNTVLKSEEFVRLGSDQAERTPVKKGVRLLMQLVEGVSKPAHQCIQLIGNLEASHAGNGRRHIFLRHWTFTAPTL